jgi:ankyrin repeat protein
MSKQDNDFDWEQMLQTIDKRRRKEFKPRTLNILQGTNFQGWSVLMRYLMFSSQIDPKVVKALLKAQNSVTHQSHYGNTPLMIAMANKSITPEIVQILVDAGADPLKRYSSDQCCYHEYLMYRLNWVEDEA